MNAQANARPSPPAFVEYQVNTVTAQLLPGAAKCPESGSETGIAGRPALIWD